MHTIPVSKLDKTKLYTESKFAHELAEHKDYACIIAVFDHLGNIVLVKDVEGDDKKGFQPKLKFPGGRQETGELPPETASRELAEETGVEIQPQTLFLGLFDEENREDHFRYWFIAIVPEFSHLNDLDEDGKVKNKRGIEGEEIYVKSYEKIKADLEFLNSHYWGLENLLNRFHNAHC